MTHPPTPIDDARTCERAASIVGTGAVLWIMASLVLTIVRDKLLVDPVMIAVIVLAVALGKGSRRCATAICIILALYLIGAIGVTAVILYVGPVTRMGPPQRPADTGVEAIGLAILLAAWCCWGIRASWLARAAALRMMRRREGKCAHCGYILDRHENTRCPECGAPNDVHRAPPVWIASD